MALALAANLLPLALGDGYGKGMKFSKFMSNPMVQGAAFQLGSYGVNKLLGNGMKRCGSKKYRLSHGLGVAAPPPPVPFGGMIAPPVPFGGMIGKLYVPPKINWTPKQVNRPAPSAPMREAPISHTISPAHLPETSHSLPAKQGFNYNSMVNKLPSKMSTLYPMAKKTYSKIKGSLNKVPVSKISKTIGKVGNKLSTYGNKKDFLRHKVARKTGSLLTGASKAIKNPKQAIKKVYKKAKKAIPRIKEGLMKIKRKIAPHASKAKRALLKRMKHGSGLNPVIPGPLP